MREEADAVLAGITGGDAKCGRGGRGGKWALSPPKDVVGLRLEKGGDGTACSGKCTADDWV